MSSRRIHCEWPTRVDVRPSFDLLKDMIRRSGTVKGFRSLWPYFS